MVCHHFEENRMLLIYSEPEYQPESFLLKLLTHEHCSKTSQATNFLCLTITLIQETGHPGSPSAPNKDN